VCSKNGTPLPSRRVVRSPWDSAYLAGPPASRSRYCGPTGTPTPTRGYLNRAGDSRSLRAALDLLIEAGRAAAEAATGSSGCSSRSTASSPTPMTLAGHACALVCDITCLGERRRVGAAVFTVYYILFGYCQRWS